MPVEPSVSVETGPDPLPLAPPGWEWEEDEDPFAGLPPRWEAERERPRLPVSLSALILFLTFASGVGVAAGLLAGWAPLPPGPPTPVLVVNNTTSPRGITNGSGAPGGGGAPPPNNSGGGGSGSGNGSGGKGNGTGNSTGNGTGNQSQSPGGNGTKNGTGENGSGDNSSGNSSGKNGTGTNGTGPGPGNPSNSSRTSPNGSTRPVWPFGNNTTVVFHAPTPWLPEFVRFGLLLAGFAGLGGLAFAVLIDSFSPPARREDPWARRAPTSTRRRPRPPRDPRRAIGDAIAQLQAALDAQGWAYIDGRVPPEVRARIVAVYAQLLRSVGAGLGDLHARTPREIEARCVRDLGITPATAHELTWLFEEARYSSHPLGANSVERAKRALASALVDLKHFSRAAG